MLKKRLVATIIVRNGIVVQSIGFKRYLPVGRPEIAVEFLNRWGIDEIILIDISASKHPHARNYDFIRTAADHCQVPVTAGGGVESIEDIRQLLALGADKVVMNSACFGNADLIRQAAAIFGQQCIVVGIDVTGADPSTYSVFNAAAGRNTGLDPVAWALELETAGAGEIFLTSVDRDGSKHGFDLALIDRVARAANIPVIASGGAGCPAHIAAVLATTAASAASAANYFHFSEHSVIIAKAAIRAAGVDLRIDTFADYSHARICGNGRLARHTDDYLADLLFRKIEIETI